MRHSKRKVKMPRTYQRQARAFRLASDPKKEIARFMSAFLKNYARHVNMGEFLLDVRKIKLLQPAMAHALDDLAYDIKMNFKFPNVAPGNQYQRGPGRIFPNPPPISIETANWWLGKKDRVRFTFTRKAILQMAKALEVSVDHQTMVRAANTFSGKSKKAGSMDIFDLVVDQRALWKIFSKIRKVDQQSADLLKEVMYELADELNLSQGAKRALNRVQGLASRGQNWDPALIRNNVFKAANDLGIKLPSGMFASKRARNRSAAWLAPNMKRALLRLFNADRNSLRKHTAWDLRDLKIPIHVANFLWDRKLIEPCCPEANDVEVTAKLTDKGAKAAQKWNRHIKDFYSKPRPHQGL